MGGVFSFFFIFFFFFHLFHSAVLSSSSAQHHHHHRRRTARHNYRDALTKSILFFEGQRSGRLPSTQRMTWRSSSGLSDGSSMHVDLVGGYYDAGDNVKFGFPMAFTTTMLSWSVIEFGGKMKSELRYAKEAVRWSSDYLLKATVKPNTIYVQVGDAQKDHSCWERPEDMDTPRTVFKVDRRTPGSDVAGETAAALASAALVFRKSDPRYSRLLLSRAIRVFRFADRYRGAYSNGLKSFVCPFYCSFSGYKDELLWGAVWLYKATRSRYYLRYIKANGEYLGGDGSDNTFGWDNKHVGARILLSKEFLVHKMGSLRGYKAHADNYICSVIPGTHASQFTPAGLLFKMSDDNMQYVTSTAFLLVTYAKYLTYSSKHVSCGGGTTASPKLLRRIAQRQVDYLLGDNPLRMSYMVGYGGRYPRRIHHRGSSMPSVKVHPAKITCSSGFMYMQSRAPNPNVLVGAVIGGPDSKDRFSDQRPDYEQSEPSTYTNAPLVGALTYLAHSYGQL